MNLTLGALLARLPLEPLENRILLGHALGLSRVALITESQRELTPEEVARVEALVARRVAGEPVAYIVGTREFYGLPFQVSPAVLIPRPETEHLVELALERMPPRARVLDMGTGSGAIAVALAHTRPDAQVTALDRSPEALAVARANAAANGAPVRFLQSDWFSALADDERFDVIASNPPYVAAGDPHLAQGDLRFEPTGALTDEADGLQALRTIAAGAPAHLAPGGWLLMEHGYDQGAAVRQLLQRDFDQVQSWRDLAGIERVTGGRLR